MTDKVLILNKPSGLTPLQLIQKLKEDNQDLRHTKIGYAGRLDPMASGLVLLMVGEENKRRAQYLGLPKTYEADILLGVETDSYDVLGHIVLVETKEYEEGALRTALQSFVGTYEQTYPPYSSKTVAGKPLFYYAQNNLPIPHVSKKVTIISVNKIKIAHLSTEILAADIIKRIEQVQGNFRQEATIDDWRDFAKKYPQKKWYILSVTIECSSGTYIRALAHELGKKLESAACLLHLKRTRIGPYTLGDT